MRSGVEGVACGMWGLGTVGCRILDFGFWVLGFGVWMLGVVGFWVLGLGFWISDFGFWVLTVGYCALGFRFGRFPRHVADRARRGAGTP